MYLLKLNISIKRIINGIFLLLLMFFTLFNCKTEDETLETSNSLKNYTFGAKDVKITYDIQGKPVALGNNAINYNSGSRITIIDPYYYFTYNDIGKISTISATANTMYSTEDASITYNNQNLLQTELVRFVQTQRPNKTFEFSRKFIYDNSQKLVEIVENSIELNGIPSLRRELLSYDREGNIIQIIKQISINNGENYHNESTTKLTYDTKNNPFYNLLVNAGIVKQFTLLQHFGIPTISLGHANLKLQYYNPHNLLSLKTTTPTGKTKTIRYQYTYDKKDFPISLVKTITKSETEISREYYNWYY